RGRYLLRATAHTPRPSRRRGGRVPSAHGDAPPLRPSRVVRGARMMEGGTLPLVWFAIIAFGIFMYVLLDGFVLGTGLLFPWAPNEADRSAMMMSVAPIWDGNETWLVLGAGGLFAAFPLA